jgi:hypothetical protein
MQLKLLQRHLHTHVFCSIIHNSQAIETAKYAPLLMNGLRKCDIYHNEILLSYKKEGNFVIRK